MAKGALSPRETEVVDLSIIGMTSKGIAKQLGISLSTVNTYWESIRLKIGGASRQEVTARIVKARGDRELADMHDAFALLNLTTDQLRSTAWTTDRDLKLRILTHAEFLAGRTKAEWKTGLTVFELFETRDISDLAVAAHLSALAGVARTVTLAGDFVGMTLRVVPLTDDSGEIVGCASILTGAVA